MPGCCGGVVREKSFVTSSGTASLALRSEAGALLLFLGASIKRTTFIIHYSDPFVLFYREEKRKREYYNAYIYMYNNIKHTNAYDTKILQHTKLLACQSVLQEHR